MNSKAKCLSVVATIIATASLSVGCTAQKGFIVSIEDGKMEYEIEEAKACTVSQVLKEAGIELGEGDEISMDTGKKLAKNTDIVINRLVNVVIKYDGKKYDVSLCGSNVKQAIKEAGVPIPSAEYVNHELSAPLEEGMKIVVNKVQVKTEKKEKPIKFKTVEKETSDLVRGETKVSQEGVDGIRTITYKVTYVDGKEVKRKKVKSKVTQEPVDEIILVGTAEPKPEPEPQQQQQAAPERTVVSQENYDDCDGSGHGYSVITYSDGSTEQREY